MNKKYTLTNKIYVVVATIEYIEENECYSEVITNNYFTDRDEARKTMLQSFCIEKTNYDNTDTLKEYVSLDECDLDINSKKIVHWKVFELTK